MTMTGEIQGTKKEFIKIFNEMCYSRSGWQVWSDLISTMASWVCRLYLHRQYHNESACWTRFIPTGNGRAGAVDHTDVSIKCMGVEAAVPFSRKFRRICRYETDYRKRALLYVF